ncbi:MAG: hypothetical protein OXH32_03800 [Acidobacteria bacterium]|nr:hypothetical protein [Acidobacteriota bacterium]
MTPQVKTYTTSILFPIELRPRIHAAAAAESRRPTEWMREVVRDALARAEDRKDEAATATSGPSR